jgi:chemotaxis protein CheX
VIGAGTSASSTGASREGWLPTLALAMREVFDLMLACPLEVTKLPPPPDKEGIDVVSMVGLAGQLTAVLSLRCSPKAAARMASRMLGADSEMAGPETWDAVGEICNMVAGNFKNKISGMGDGCKLSVPTVISRADHDVHARDDNNFRVVFLFEGEPVILSLEIQG